MKQGKQQFKKKWKTSNQCVENHSYLGTKKSVALLHNRDFEQQ